MIKHLINISSSFCKYKFNDKQWIIFSSTDERKKTLQDQSNVKITPSKSLSLFFPSYTKQISTECLGKALEVSLTHERVFSQI